MAVRVVIGGQWGDEGKGRLVDLLARDARAIVRYSAGNNAGHTVINERGEFALHLIPAGVFYPGKICVISNGVAVDPAVLLQEIEGLESRGVSTENLVLSDRAHVIMPYHMAIDRADEELRGKAAIGTTGRGVGPAFVDKVGRLGIRVADLVDPEALRTRLEFVLTYKNAVLKRLYGVEPLDFTAVYEPYRDYGERLLRYVRDTALLLHEIMRDGGDILLEGAQGSLLDLDSGTYEYVTSSVPSSTAAGAGIGAGIGPTEIDEVIGVYKAYMTRVGNGPMPTELLDETGDILRMEGPRPEIGTTTGRPRRCGWFDAVASRHSALVNGVTMAALTRLDVLDRFSTIPVCTAYRVDGKEMTTMPASASVFARAEPIYEELTGWQADISKVRNLADLPEQARAYVRRISELLGVDIGIISVGPERDQAISVRAGEAR